MRRSFYFEAGSNGTANVPKHAMESAKDRSFASRFREVSGSARYQGGHAQTTVKQVPRISISRVIRSATPSAPPPLPADGGRIALPGRSDLLGDRWPPDVDAIALVMAGVIVALLIAGAWL